MAWLSSQHLSQWAYCDNSGDIGIRIGEKGILCASRGFQRITGSGTPAVSASAGHNLCKSPSGILRRTLSTVVDHP